MNQNANAEPITNLPIRPDPSAVEERGWQPYRLSVRQYLKAIDAGVFDDDARVELLGGILVAPMTKGDAHNYLAMILPPALRGVVPPPWLVVTEISLRLGPRSRPEPDLLVLQGPASRFKVRPPAAQDVAIVVEIADTSYRFDRGSRWQRYAAALVPVYWIINLRKRQVEVYRDPIGTKATAVYETAEVYDANSRVPVVIDGVEVGQILVREILP